MLEFERRWVHDILSSFAPEAGESLAPPAAQIDYVATFAGMHASARPLARAGFRLALWLVALSPCWLLRRGATMAGLPAAARRTLLARLLEHRVYVVREAAFLMKLAACLALFANDEVRARSGYDGRAEVVPRP